MPVLFWFLLILCNFTVCISIGIRIYAYPVLVFSMNILLYSSFLCLLFVYVCLLSMFVYGLVLRIDLRKGLFNEKSFELCLCL